MNILILESISAMNRRFKDKYSFKITIGRTGEPFQASKQKKKAYVKHMCYNSR